MRAYFHFILDSVLANRRRALITVAIIAVGVSALVGIQAALDVMAESVAGSFNRMGTGLCSIRPKADAPSLTLQQARAFCQAWPDATAWVETDAIAQVRSGGAATDPVVHLIGCDAAYVSCNGAQIAEGRDFTARDVEQHQPVAVLGDNVRRKLFGAGSGVGEWVSCPSGRYRRGGVRVFGFLSGFRNGTVGFRGPCRTADGIGPASPARCVAGFRDRPGRQLGRNAGVDPAEAVGCGAGHRPDYDARSCGRPDEQHAGRGERADAGNRRLPGAGCPGSDGEASVPDGSDGHRAGGLCRRRASGPVIGQSGGAGHGRRFRGALAVDSFFGAPVLGRQSPLRPSPRPSRRRPRPHRGPA